MSMDAERLLRASSLLGGQLKQRRDSIRKELIKLSIMSCGGEFTTEDVISECESKFGISFDASIVVNTLNEVEGDLIEGNNGSYSVLRELEFESFEELLEPIWVEFKEQLRLYSDKVDPYYTSQVSPAFNRFFKEFFLEIADSVETLNKYQKDTIYTSYGRTDELINDVIEREGLSEPQVFREAIHGYIEDPGENLLDFTATCYTAAVNIDLLAKEEELIEFPKLPDRNRKLILDTNILVALLADTHVHHETADTICLRSIGADMDFDLFYLDETARELDRYINGATQEMSGLVADDSLLGAENAFVEDFREKPSAEWEDYLDELENWKKSLEEEYGIQKYSTDESPNTEVKEQVEELLLGSGGELDDREMRRINHDSSILGIAATEREKSDMSFGPFVLSFHNQLTQIGQGLAENPNTQHITGGKPLALQPRSWLNYIISFTPVELDRQDMKKVSLAVLRGASDFEEDLEIDEYVHTLAPKVGLESEDEESLKNFLLSHSLAEELESAIDSDDPIEAEQISREIIKDDEHIEAIRQERDFKDRIRNASSRINELEQEVRGLKPVVSFEGLDLTDESEFRTGYGKVVDALQRGQVDLGLETPPPDSDADISEISEWLEDTISLRSDEELGRIQPQLERLFANSVIIM